MADVVAQVVTSSPATGSGAHGGKQPEGREDTWLGKTEAGRGRDQGRTLYGGQRCNANVRHLLV